MEKKILIFSCVIFFAMSMVCGIVSYKYPGLHRALAKQSDGIKSSESVADLLGGGGDLVDKSGMPHNLRLELPRDFSESNLAISPDYLEQSLDIVISGINDLYLMEHPMSGDGQNIKDIIYFSDGKTGTVKIFFEQIMISNSFKEGNYLYLDFKRPKEVYERIIVLDAGHGGNDNGARAGGVLEKDINLAIVNEIYDSLKDRDGKTGVFTTRDTDVFMSPEERVSFANGLDADIMVSVHQNSTSSGRVSDIDGTEVMYFSADKSGESKKLSGVILDKLTKVLGSRNRGLVPGDDILILRKSKGVCVLVEVGFMTNKEELSKLMDPGYQKNAADGIVEGIMEYLK